MFGRHKAPGESLGDWDGFCWDMLLGGMSLFPVSSGCMKLNGSILLFVRLHTLCEILFIIGYTALRRFKLIKALPPIDITSRHVLYVIEHILSNITWFCTLNCDTIDMRHLYVPIRKHKISTVISTYVRRKSPN